MSEHRRRSGDQGWITRWWDWVDQRDIDKHALSLGIFYGTIRVTSWAMQFADNAIAFKTSLTDIAVVIAAVLAPYMALQGAAVAFYFKART